MASGRPGVDRSQMDAWSNARLALELSELANRLESSSKTSDNDQSHADELLRSITTFGDLARVSLDLQADAIRASHTAGVSWTRLGQQLGISRQAVQQRFDPNYRAVQPAEDEATRYLGPVTRDEELQHLNAAAQDGWRPIRSFAGRHLMLHDGAPWEVQRVSLFVLKRMPKEDDGWKPATIRFPDCFYVRLREHSVDAERQT